MMNKRAIQFLLCLMIVFSMLAIPAAAAAQIPEPPPEWDGFTAASDDDVLVIEPQFFFELPIVEGFTISFNFGFSFRVPRQLTLVTEEGYNFFVRFRSYVVPAGEAITD